MQCLSVYFKLTALHSFKKLVELTLCIVKIDCHLIHLLVGKSVFWKLRYSSTAITLPGTDMRHFEDAGVLYVISSSTTFMRLALLTVP